MLLRPFWGSTTRLAISMYTASLAALVLFIPNQHILLSRPSSSSSLVAPSSLPNGDQELQDARTTNDVNLQYLRHSSSRADEINMVKSILTTGNDTRNENFLLECSSRTNGEKLSKNLVSTSEFYSPKSKCKHDFRSSVVFFHVGENHEFLPRFSLSAREGEIKNKCTSAKLSMFSNVHFSFRQSRGRNCHCPTRWK